MAPEIIKGETHSFPCDMWSMGIILYFMLSGAYPFSFRKLEEDIMNTPVLFLGPNWDKVSMEAKHLVSQLLEKDQFSRITAKDALSHAWFNRQIPQGLDEKAPGYL